MNSSDITKKDNEEINKNKSIIENIKSNYILKIFLIIYHNIDYLK